MAEIKGVAFPIPKQFAQRVYLPTFYHDFLHGGILTNRR